MMATLLVYYNIGDDTHLQIYGNHWSAQTFITAATPDTITSIKLKLWRDPGTTPGTVTVGIRATDGSGHPTGSDLASGTTDGNTLATAPPYEWREITIPDYIPATSTKYAIVVRAPSGTVVNCIYWRVDATSPTYADGNDEESTDGGSSWSTGTYDFMFEVWGASGAFIGVTDSGVGTESAVTVSASITVSETGVGTEVPTIASAFSVADSGAGVESSPIIGVMAADEGKFAEFAWRTKPTNPMIDDLALPHVLSIRISDPATMSDKKVQGGSLSRRKMVGKPGRTVEIQGWSDSQAEIDALDALRDGARRTFYPQTGDSFGVLVTAFQPSRTADKYNRRTYRLSLAEAN